MGKSMYVATVLFSALLLAPVGGGEPFQEGQGKVPCSAKNITMLGDKSVPCVNIQIPPSGKDPNAVAAYDVLMAEGDDAWILNQKSLEIARLLMDNEKTDPKALVKASREAKKAADDLCKRLDCEEKKKR